MEDFPVNAADALIVVILLVSGALAFVRGFVRESLGMAAWVGAALVTAYSFGPAQPLLRKLIDITLLADAITGISIFVVTLIILIIITHAVASGVRGGRLGAVDRSLGFVFGVVRGAIVVCLAYMLLVWAVPEDRPAWIEEARLMPWVKEGGEVIRNLVPLGAAEEGAEIAEDLKRKSEAAAEAGRNLRLLTEPGGDSEAEKEKGYGTDERKALDSVIETIE